MIIIDDFIKDDALLNDIENDSTFFGPNGNFMWWDGWWNSEPNTIKKRLIEVMWKYHSPHDFPRYESITGLVGFEYWTGVYGDGHPNTALGSHLDKDEEHWLATGGNDGGEVHIPVMGTIFYPKQHDFDGGFLEIHSKHYDKEPERIAAKYNRLVLFEAGEHLHRVSEVTNGVRYAIAVNLWQTEPKALHSGNFTIE
jgi:hypothetical protein|tara:strand:- start:1719 stop:2309 length:591 start_codon:yes stop_codon:yes gene_type:complete